MEAVRFILPSTQKGDFLTSIDLSEAFLHIPIRESHRKFLRFAYAGKLKSSPRVFTKTIFSIFRQYSSQGTFRISGEASSTTDDSMPTRTWISHQLCQEYAASDSEDSAPGDRDRHFTCLPILREKTQVVGDARSGATFAEVTVSLLTQLLGLMVLCQDIVP